MAEMAGNGRKLIEWHEVNENGIKWKYLERPKMTKNGCRWLEMAENI